MQIMKSEAQATYTAEADVQTESAFREHAFSRDIVPDHITVEYLYEPYTNEEGWTVHRWSCKSVEIRGRFILEEAADGDVIMSTTRTVAVWYHPETRPAPDEIMEAVVALRPSGQIETIKVQA